MTELQFQKRIPNDKNEIIFHFCAITNIYSNSNFNIACAQRFSGDVIVNLTTKQTYISPRALSALIDNHIESVAEVHAQEIKSLNDKDRAEFMKIKCKEAVISTLFENCEKLKDVIL